jgi:hypothetical protein
MAELVEHLVQAPCGWCGEPIQQPSRGRKLRYCNRSCRQRAYEIRTAQARRQTDVDAGRITQEPAERIVERVVRPKFPRTPAAWEAALMELSNQLADGTIAFWNADRIQRALAGAVEQADNLAGTTPQPSVDERLLETAEKLLRGAASELTTLERLAAVMHIGVDELRQTMLELEHTGLLVARRLDKVVPVDELHAHARFLLTATQF